MKWISTTTWIGLAVTLLFLCLTPVIIDEVLIREMGMSQSGAEKLQLLFLSAFIVLCLCLFTFRRYQKLTLTMAIIASLPFIPFPRWPGKRYEALSLPQPAKERP
ncbi:MAG: hypothetical protein Sw2LagTSB_07280 [Shewanella algae]